MATSIPLLTEFSEPAPNRSMDEDDFAPAADTFAAELTAFVPEMNTSITATNTLAGEIEVIGAAAETARAAAVVAKTASETARDASVVAKTASETAQGLSEVARDASIAAKNLAQNYADALIATSATSHATTVGTKTGTTQLNKQFAGLPYGSFVSSGTPADKMHGAFTAYNPATGAYTFVAASVEGAGGTHTDWAISVSGARGPQGAVGPSAVLTRAAFTGSLTGTAGNHYDMTAAGDLTFPTAPVAGDRIGFSKLTLAQTRIISAKPIQGQPAGTFPIAKLGFGAVLEFKDNTYGWVK